MGKCHQQHAHDWVEMSNMSLNPEVSIWANASSSVSWSIALPFQMRVIYQHVCSLPLCVSLGFK